MSPCLLRTPSGGVRADVVLTLPFDPENLLGQLDVDAHLVMVVSSPDREDVYTAADDASVAEPHLVAVIDLRLLGHVATASTGRPSPITVCDSMGRAPPDLVTRRPP